MVMHFASCSGKEAPVSGGKTHLSFDTERFIVKESSLNKVRGQVLYVPMYSNIACGDHFCQ